MKQDFNFSKIFKTACGISFISMISMEIAINLAGGAILICCIIPIMLIA
tara:strand:+ start:985 stop:1131 length:147 start_codon:yes stop_codon:yes gene_type:complete